MNHIDLHMHTTHSDGTYAPRDLVRLARERNLRCISVTDHDTMSSFEECRDEAARQGIEYISGIEISAVFEPGTLHILGYFLDPVNTELKRFLAEIQMARRERNPQIIVKLQAQGIKITKEDVFHEAGACDWEEPNKQIGRPHFARALVKKGYVQSIQEAFEKLLSRGQPAYVDKRRVSSREAINVIHQAGGVASIAHPKQMKLDEAQFEKEMTRLVGEGMDGIEVYNSCQNTNENALFLRMAKKFDLIATGGSDFHGSNKQGVELGRVGDSIKLDQEMIDKMRERIAKRN